MLEIHIQDSAIFFTSLVHSLSPFFYTRDPDSV